MGTKRKSPLTVTEAGIVEQFADWLDYSGYVWHYVPNRGKFQLGNDKKTPGAPDIVVNILGLYVGIEAKKPGKKQSPEQKEFQAKAQKEGGEFCYLLLDNLDDLMKVIPEIKAMMIEANK